MSKYNKYRSNKIDKNLIKTTLNLKCFLIKSTNKIELKRLTPIGIGFCYPSYVWRKRSVNAYEECVIGWREACNMTVGLYRSLSI
jgi:hypothetical protein